MQHDRGKSWIRRDRRKPGSRLHDTRVQSGSLSQHGREAPVMVAFYITSFPPFFTSYRTEKGIRGLWDFGRCFCAQ